MNKIINPYIKIILASLIFGSSGAFVKYIDLPIILISFFRTAIPSAFLIFYFIIFKKRITTINIRVMLFASLLNAVRIFLFFVGFTYADISSAVILLYTWPVFTTIFSVIFLNEKFTLRRIFLLALAFTGIIIIYSNNNLVFSNNKIIGLTAILFSAITYSLTVIIFKKQSNNYNQFETVFYQNIAGAILFLPALYFIDLPDLLRISMVSSYSFIIGVVAFGLFFSGLKYIKASTASFITYIEVVCAILYGRIFFGEIITSNMIIGGVLILSAAFFVKRD